MPQEDSDETYSVIYAALKHPIRRKILRLLKEEELSYTQILNKLDVDTGHLNYYLESLGELVAKTSEGKYRLSEYGLAAVKLMTGVEETDPALGETKKTRLSKRRITHLTQAVCIIALVLTGTFLTSITNVQSYWLEASGSLDSKNLITLAPNETFSSFDYASARNYHADTITTHYRAFLQIEIVQANVSLHIEVTEAVFPEASFPIEETSHYVQYPVLIYNETHEGPYGYDDANGTSTSFSKLSYTIKIPIMYPQEKGMLVSNSFSHYNTNITSLGTAMLYHPPTATSRNGSTSTVANNTGSMYLKITYPLIERTDYPYFYHGLVLICLAVVVAILPFIVIKKIRKR
jgi:DNA-binding transcriptional ArsR family regulator